MGLYIIIGLITLGVAGAIFAVALIFMGDNEKLDDRLASLTRNGGRGLTGAAEGGPQSSILRSPLEEAPNFIEQQLKSLIKMFNLRKLIEQSGLELKVANFLMMTIGLGIGGIVLCLMLLPAKIGFLSAPFVGLVLAFFPYIYVMFKRGRRLKKFANQLPQALDLMSQAMRAGQSLPAGIQLVGQQVAAPLGPEFHTAYEQQNLGSTIVDSLEQMCDRIPDLDLRFFATAVMLQRQTGGDLAEILDKIGKLVRERMQIKGMIQALTGEGRISGSVLLAMPPILFLVMLKLNYEYVMKLFEEPLGHKMLAVAIAMQIVGALWIKKIINIKV